MVYIPMEFEIVENTDISPSNPQQLSFFVITESIFGFGVLPI